MTTNEEIKGASNRALIWSLAGGIALSIPAGHVLAYLAALPAFLGLFFYLLIGLLIGAVMFRLGKGAIPAPKQSLWVIGVTISVLAWMTGLISEYRMLPKDVSEAVVKHSVIQSASKQEIQRFSQQIEATVVERLRHSYPPGGLVGYWRWRASDGAMELPLFGSTSPKYPDKWPTKYVYTMAQRKFVWMIRVILSLVLLTFALQSQFLGLARLPSEADAGSVHTEQDPIQSS